MAVAARLLVFVAVQLLVVGAWWGWLRRAAAGLTRPERLLCAGLLGLAQIVGASLLLAWIGWLAPAPLLVLSVATSAGLWVACRRASPPVRPRACTGRAAPSSGTLRAGAGALALLLALALAAALLRDARRAEAGWDGLNYHLPMVALMRQTHGLAFPPVHNQLIAAYPKNVELWAHWILAFSADDRWLELAQLPFLALAVLAIYVMARRLRASRAAAAVGALLPAFAPVVLTQITTAYSDVAQSALLLGAVALLLTWRATAAPAAALGFAATLGLLLGTKYSGLSFALLLFTAFALVTWRAHGRGGLAPLAGVAALALLLGADAYVRNWRQHGNPVFPYRVSAAGAVIFPGPAAPTDVYGFAETRALSPLARHARSWAAVDVVRYSTLFGGFGVVGPFLAVCGALSLGLALRARDRPRLALGAVFAALFAVTPLSFRLRFVIYVLGLGGVGLAHLLDHAAPRARAILLAAGLAVAAISTLQYLAAMRDPGWHDLASGSARLDVCRDTEPPQYRPGLAWLRQHAAPGSRAVVFRSPGEALMPYCLWTPRLDNQVEFAATDDPGAAAPDALRILPHGSPAYARFAAADPAQWRILFADDAMTIAQPAAGAEGASGAAP